MSIVEINETLFLSCTLLCCYILVKYPLSFIPNNVFQLDEAYVDRQTVILYIYFLICFLFILFMYSRY